MKKKPENKQNITSKSPTSKNRSTIIILFFVILLVGGVFAYKSVNRSGSISTKQTGSDSSNKELLSKAKREGNPAYILFHSSNCAPCQEMEKIADKVVTSFAGKIIFVDVNVYDPSDQELISQFGIQSIPTSIFIGRDGEIKGSEVGVIPEENLKEILSKLVDDRL